MLLLWATSAIYVYVTLFTSEMFVQEATQHISFPIAKHIVDKIDPIVDNQVNWSSLNFIFDGATMLNPGIEIYLLSPVGKILAASVPEERIEHKQVSLKPIEEFLHGDSYMFVLGDDPLRPNKEKVFSAAPVSRDGKTDGYIYVILRGEEYDSAMNMMLDSYILQLGTRAFVITLIATMVMALLVLRLMMNKLHRITDGVKNFEGGDYNSRIPVKSNDELDQLAETFNSMADTIVAHMDELKNGDAMRRELVANVSHDLRTPLASIQGYVETLLLKMDTFSEDKRRKYLEVVLQSSQNLSTLVEELFTFSKLDTHQIKPNFEPFPITELVHDLIQKLQPQAEDQKIRLRSLFAQDLPFVYADIGMVERALQNLIDNALRYSPEIGVVTVEMKHAGNQINVSVSDTGEGIHSEDLPHIFDRFYRGGKRQARTTGGAGLGLAITKKIIETHDGEISVQSTLNEGTQFSFSLPVAVD